MDSSGFKTTHASQYYTERAKFTRRHDNNIDFQLLITKISEVLPLSVVTADKGYDRE